MNMLPHESNDDAKKQQQQLQTRLAVLSKEGSHQALREEIQKILFGIQQMGEHTMKNGSYHLLGKKVAVAMTQLNDLIEVLNELRRQGASDT